MCIRDRSDWALNLHSWSLCRVTDILAGSMTAIFSTVGIKISNLSTGLREVSSVFRGYFPANMEDPTASVSEERHQRSTFLVQCIQECRALSGMSILARQGETSIHVLVNTGNTAI